MFARIRLAIAVLAGRPVVSGVTFTDTPGWEPSSLAGGVVHGCTFRT